MSDEPEDWAEVIAERLRVHNQRRGFDAEVAEMVVEAFRLGVHVARGGSVPELEEGEWKEDSYSSIVPGDA